MVGNREDSMEENGKENKGPFGKKGRTGRKIPYPMIRMKLQKLTE
ncbi:hypothetical protein ACYULU_08940 [Breznakiellaceae bacterium SP9]